MIYKSSSPHIKTIIDLYRTGKYGDEEYPQKSYCSHCGAIIQRGESCYIVRDNIFCMDCEDVAEELILELYRERFIYDY